MADDGMLLNFSIGEAAPFAQKHKLHGGSWRARRQAHRAAQNDGNKQPATKTPDYSANSEPLARRPRDVRQAKDASIDGPPAKRRRVEDGVVSKKKPLSDHNVGNRDNHGQPKQVISSLFRFNPTSTTKPDTPAEPTDETPVEPSNAPLSAEAENFTSLGISATLARHLTEKMNIKRPTAIQKAAIAELLKSEGDAFVQAETGSGKTLAYILPIIQHIIELAEGGSGKKITRDSGLFAVVLAPTRELARQIAAVLDALLRCAHWIVPGIVIGGENKKSEKARLRKGNNILIATPGRLADHLQHTESLDVGQVRWLVLDEGDRLVELGFEEDIKRIINALDFRLQKTKKEGKALEGLPEQRTTILCSATMKMDVQRLGEISLKDARHIQASETIGDRVKRQSADKQQAEFMAPAQLKQSYAVVPAKQRLVALLALLKSQFARKGSINKAIVFISCADSVDFHFEIFASAAAAASTSTDDKDEDTADLAVKAPAVPLTAETTSAPSTHLSSSLNEVQVFRLHGSLEQKLRTSTIKAFHTSQQPAVLFCTDVASRGLDLPNIDLVIEFDPAFSRDEHLHRIGRTARAGKEGRAMVFLMPGCEESYVEVLAKDRKERLFGLRRTDGDELLRKAFAKPATGTDGKRSGKSEQKDWEEAATNWQLDVERWALADPKALEKARKAYQSHIRAYATHVAAERQYFDIKQLHLGHLAKAFALRDRPGSINVPGMRGSSTSGGKDKRRSAPSGTSKKRAAGSSTSTTSKKDWDAEEMSAAQVDAQEAARKMRAMSKMNMAGASEFNLG